MYQIIIIIITCENGLRIEQIIVIWRRGRQKSFIFDIFFCRLNYSTRLLHLIVVEIKSAKSKSYFERKSDVLEQNGHYFQNQHPKNSRKQFHEHDAGQFINNIETNQESLI